MTYHVRIPFPNELYAESAMRALAPDAPFTDSKTRKSSIRRKMHVEVLNDGVAYLNVVLTCNEKLDMQNLRTAASSMLGNLKLISETIKEFGP